MNKHKSTTQLKQFLSQLPNDPGVYRMLNQDGVVLYVGKAANLKKRVNSYFTKQNTSIKTLSLVSQIASIEISVTRSETEAYLLESNLIKQLKPKYNILMRDDKSYPYIHLSEHEFFPRIEVFRSKKKPQSGMYFGPFPSSSAAKETVLTIQKVFKIRNCSDSFFNARSRPCLQYQIKRCTAPCVEYISPDAYKKTVADVLLFLKGKSQDILNGLVTRMEEAVAELRYEEAAIIRDQIKNLRTVQEQQGVVQLKGDADVIAIESRPGFAAIQYVTIREGQVLGSRSFFPTVPEGAWSDEKDHDLLNEEIFERFLGFYYFDSPERIPKSVITDCILSDKDSMEEVLSKQRGQKCRIFTNPRGSKARWLDFALNNLRISINEHEHKKITIKQRYRALEEVLCLSKSIHKMECFDISHTQGEATIASCVVFDEHGPSPKQYRRFNIEGITPGDDYAAMEQALTRRFKRLLENQSLPDLLIIDGGKGQVGVAKKVLSSLDIHCVTLLGIAKGPSRKAGWEKLILVDENKEFVLPDDSKALHLLQHIRDEAHRFAITAHRKKRQKKRTDSTLEQIEGVGPKRRKALLQRFGGLIDLSRASLEEIAKVPGISLELAKRIYEHFK